MIQQKEAGDDDARVLHTLGIPSQCLPISEVEGSLHVALIEPELPDIELRVWQDWQSWLILPGFFAIISVSIIPISFARKVFTLRKVLYRAAIPLCRAIHRRPGSAIKPGRVSDIMQISIQADGSVMQFSRIFHIGLEVSPLTYDLITICQTWAI